MGKIGIAWLLFFSGCVFRKLGIAPKVHLIEPPKVWNKKVGGIASTPPTFSSKDLPEGHFYQELTPTLFATATATPTVASWCRCAPWSRAAARIHPWCRCAPWCATAVIVHPWCRVAPWRGATAVVRTWCRIAAAVFRTYLRAVIAGRCSLTAWAGCFTPRWASGLHLGAIAFPGSPFGIGRTGLASACFVQLTAQ